MSKEVILRKVLFTAIVNEKTGDLLLEIEGHKDTPCGTTIEFWEAFLKDFDLGEVLQQFDELDGICDLIKAGLEKMERVLSTEEEAVLVDYSLVVDRLEEMGYKHKGQLLKPHEWRTCLNFNSQGQDVTPIYKAVAVTGHWIITFLGDNNYKLEQAEGWTPETNCWHDIICRVDQKG
ncbi:hypothetical protein ES705_21332 [subsurface metagenome]